MSEEEREDQGILDKLNSGFVDFVEKKYIEIARGRDCRDSGEPYLYEKALQSLQSHNAGEVQSINDV